MSDFLSKQLKKQSTRTKEKLLESLGKATRTTDDAFEMHNNNFAKQAKASERLGRDVKAYAIAAKAFIQAQKMLHEGLRELYESEWPQRTELMGFSQSHDLIADEWERNINDEVLPSLNLYVGQFADLRNKIAKRGRKLVDYDSARHQYDTLKANNKKGDEDPKLQKSALELQQAETMYKELNDSLLDILPSLYDNRITFYVNNGQAVLNSENKYHTEAMKLNKNMIAQIDILGASLDSLRVPRDIPPPRPPTPTPIDQPTPTPIDQPTSTPIDQPTSTPIGQPISTPESTMTRNKTPPPPPVHIGENNGQEKMPEGIYPSITSSNPFEESDEEKAPVAVTRSLDVTKKVNQEKNDDRILYRVRATHRYTAEDTDELSFEAGEVVAVFEAEEELDKGWLFGQRQSDGVRGVFPANFTKNI